MPARVYEFDKSEADKLRKELEYDPFTDPNVIPSSSGKESPEEAKAREEKVNAALAKLKEDEFSNIIFKRQDYSLREGASIGLDQEKIYLYVNANEDFLKGAEGKLKRDFKSFKRAEDADEKKLIELIKEEQEKANAGFGAIFGS